MPVAAPVALAARRLGVKYDLRISDARTLRKTVASLLTRRRSQTEEFWALRGVDLIVRPGEIVGVIGRNGSGKSTLLLALCGIVEPDEGSVRSFKHSVSLLTLGAGFEPELTGRQNIYLNAAYLGISRREIEERVDPIISFAELGDFIDVPLKKYSTGMRSRLGFSIAAHVEPDVLLLDEILGVGDLEFQAKSKERLEELMSRSRAIVVVSHNMSFVRSTCSSVLWLDAGRAAAYGDAAEVVATYEASVKATNDAPRTSPQRDVYRLTRQPRMRRR